jgi:hypothetical protein
MSPRGTAGAIMDIAGSCPAEAYRGTAGPRGVARADGHLQLCHRLARGSTERQRATRLTDRPCPPSGSWSELTVRC